MNPDYKRLDVFEDGVKGFYHRAQGIKGANRRLINVDFCLMHHTRDTPTLAGACRPRADCLELFRDLSAPQ